MSWEAERPIWATRKGAYRAIMLASPVTVPHILMANALITSSELDSWSCLNLDQHQVQDVLSGSMFQVEPPTFPSILAYRP